MTTIERGSVKILKGRFAILNFNSARRSAGLFGAVALLCASPFAGAQTVGTGSIVGIVTDPAHKVIAGAKVEITNEGKHAQIHVTTSSAGLYSSGPIQPGDYLLLVEIKGFNPAKLPVVVQVGNVTRADVAMKLGPEVGQVEVPGGTTVNIEQATVQSVVSGDQMEKLPVNGRNFLDLAQLEPGVQMQDGGLFEGKDGLSSISFLSQYGRSERIELDGVDISDEAVGGTTQNIPASAIQEFQLGQSLLDLSTGLTSSGAVNVITRSGSNEIHGGAFGVFRGNQGAADLPGTAPSSFQRELFGADAGGAIVKGKVFWFADAERAQQNLTAGEPFTYPFDGLNATLSEPYREFNTDERVDWNMRGSTRAFYRFNFFQNNDLRPYGSASSTQDFRDINNTATNAVGVDFNTGVYAHSLRFEYLKLRNEMEDATGSLIGLENPIPGLGINIGASTAGNCVLSEGGSYCGGPSWLGPQQTVQSDKLARYDGSRVMGTHIIRYGIEFNRIDAGRLADYSEFPQVGTTSLVGSTSADPTSYPANWVSLGNGIAFSTPKASFGFPGGGLDPDNRIEMYVGDAWKARPRLTLNYGLHYVRDSGRTDSGLGALPDLNQWGAGLGEKIRNPNVNFAPRLGFAWDAGGNGKTVIRGGGGLVYANSLWNNTLLDGPSRRSMGIFTDAPEVCQGGIANAFNWPTNPGVAGTAIAGAAATVVTNATTGAQQVLPNFCGGTISAIAPQILALSNAFQAAAASVTGSQLNSNYVGTTQSALNPNYDLLYPSYRTPRSWQMNIGIEKEIRPGTVLSVDYIREIGEHYLIGQDINHSGAARSFNQANAVAARDAAQAANGCPVGYGQATCMINSTVASGGTTPLGVAGAQAAYSRAGLDSNLQATGGGPCSYCAFPGTNPITQNNGVVGGVDMLFPDGRSLYTGVQMKLVTRVDKPIRGVKTGTFQFSYTLSRLVSQVQDQDFANLATDNDDPLRFTGPSALDRKEQYSFSGIFDLPFYLKLSMIGHFYSPLPQSLLLPELTNGGEIFATDWLGSGLGSAGNPEPLPGSQIGEYQHSVNIDNLQKVINTYNHTFAASLTPAGDCLVGNHTACPGLITGPMVMTSQDMAALGWIMPTIGSVANHALATPWLKTMDLRLSWPIKVKDRVTIEPSASVFNVFNFANAFQSGNMPSASLLPGPNGVLAPSVVGGVASGSSYMPFRTSFQSGTFALGAPRQFEFGLRISF
ncbi:MAG: carboxypeptidase regulatory-like domain-containing protein [Candidatus Sulfotelmatobacter sp.]